MHGACIKLHSIFIFLPSFSQFVTCHQFAWKMMCGNKWTAELWTRTSINSVHCVRTKSSSRNKWFTWWGQLGQIQFIKRRFTPHSRQTFNNRRKAKKKPTNSVFTFPTRNSVTSVLLCQFGKRSATANTRNTHPVLFLTAKIVHYNMWEMLWMRAHGKWVTCQSSVF